MFRIQVLNLELTAKNYLRREELRVICGTRGIPGTVAPFRAWRGSRDLVAQSPKFHAPADAQIPRDRDEKSSIAPRAQLENDAHTTLRVSLFQSPTVKTNYQKSTAH